MNKINMDKDILKYAQSAYGFLREESDYTCEQLAGSLKATYSLKVAQNASVYQCLMRYAKLPISAAINA